MIKVKIEGDDYMQCEEASHNYWANEKKGGQWNPGLLNSAKDSRRTERTGLLGEKAFEKLTGIPVNFQYRKFGDDKDFVVPYTSKDYTKDYTLDVKTASRDYGAGLVRVIDEYGTYHKPQCDFYAFAYIEQDDRQKQEATVVFMGVAITKDLESKKPVPARKGRHQNYEITYDELIPIDRFVESINTPAAT